MSKRTLDGFFSPASKRTKVDCPTTTTSTTTEPCSVETTYQDLPTTTHSTYPWPVPHLPPNITEEVELLVTAEGKEIRDQPDLDLLYFQPFIPKSIQRELFQFLRSQLFFYRVKYNIQRFGKEITINTPRFTTVFGLDETSRLVDDGARIVETSDPSRTVRSDKYKCKPRPIPECLDFLRRVTEACTDTQYNFCLVNYYATGSDSISYHSDDEYFLGPDPAIASFTLGAKRDFLMRHKPPPPPKKKTGDASSSSSSMKNNDNNNNARDIKLPLESGDMILMRGPTQANWLHSIPKRAGPQPDRGRINITLRRAIIPAGTENYYRYNVGQGGVYKWDHSQNEMLPWKSS